MVLSRQSKKHWMIYNLQTFRTPRIRMLILVMMFILVLMLINKVVNFDLSMITIVLSLKSVQSLQSHVFVSRIHGSSC